ncbi:MAG TPA: hypothetical protein VIQ02_16725 [Jiangellaceae bacterium]
MFDEAVQVRNRLADLVDRLDPDAFAGPAARQLWAEFQRIDRLANAGMTLLARRLA